MTRDDIVYSERYYDDHYEYRHVMLPKDLASKKCRDRLLTEAEWRALGVQQSRGWINYAIHNPEPHIMLFKRPKNFQALTPDQQTAHFNNADAIVSSLNMERMKRAHSARMARRHEEDDYAH